jgi:putative ABC transport system substrate-binding protein
MFFDIARRRLLSALGSGAVALPFTALAQERELPVVALINGGSRDSAAALAAAFRKGLGEIGYAQGRNVTVEYHWLNGDFDRLPALVADLVRRGVAAIATPVSMAAALAAKAATATIPIVFGLSQDPVKFGLVVSLSRPGGNATGINFLNREVDAKRLDLLHQLVPRAVHIGVLINPANARTNAESTIQNVQEASRSLGLQVYVIHASTSDEIDAAFATAVGQKLDALFIAPDAFFLGRGAQIATLAARDRIPAAYPDHQNVESGGLMSYGSDLVAVFYQVGLYCGRILNGTRPADLPVMQASRFVFAINLKAAKLLGINVPRTLLALADDLIE